MPVIDFFAATALTPISRPAIAAAARRKAPTQHQQACIEAAQFIGPAWELHVASLGIPAEPLGQVSPKGPS